jgi:hypothetical protein
MERELWPSLYRILKELAKDFRQKNVTYQPWVLAAVLLWAAIHDRTISWACQPRHWSTTTLKPGRIPSPATLSRRVYRIGLGLFFRVLEERIRGTDEPKRVAFVDGKPLPVSRVSKDPDAKSGRGAGGMAEAWDHSVERSRGGGGPELGGTVGPHRLPAG